MTTLLGAVDAVFGRFKAAWDTTGHPAVYEDVPPDAAMQAAINTGSVPWARVSLRENLRSQQSLGGTGNRIFSTQGIFICEIYCPSASGVFTCRTLGTLVLEAFEGVSELNGVWYRNVRFSPVGPDGHWYHSNVYAEISYDEAR
jgi:hypothetical protein